MSKISRNDPCPCGSGKKFKHCCQAQQVSAVGQPSPAAMASQPASQHRIADPSLAFFRQALALHSQGHLEAAVENYRKGLVFKPDFPEMLSNLGNALDSLQRRSEAIDAYHLALALRPDSAEIHINLGLTYQSLGDEETAIGCFRRAIALRPDSVPAHFNLGRLQQLRGEHDLAIESYRRVLLTQPHDAQTHNNLGNAFEACGRFDDAVIAYRRAVEIDPTLIAAQTGLCSVLGRLVPQWHVPMMNDSPRNEAYFLALRNIVKPNSHVFEIGTGSGLLSMMAATAGANRVTTCEAEPIIAAMAKRIIAANGFADRIKQIDKKSTELEIGKDMDAPADVMVSEIFSSEVLGERVLSSIEDAKKRLLKPGCRIIPAKASIMIAFFAGEEIATNLGVGNVCGFDLSQFNAIVPRRQTIARNDLPIQILSEEVAAFSFDFESDAEWLPETKTLRIPIHTGGRCLGIIQWMHLQMDEQTEFVNHPGVVAPASSWTRCAYLLPQATDIRAGQTAIVSALHNRVAPWFNIEGFE